MVLLFGATLGVMVLAGAGPVLAADKRPMGQAMDAIRKGDWATAYARAALDGVNAVTVVDWHYLRAGKGTPDQVFAFLRDHPDWPGLPYLRERSEATVAKAPTAALLAFFAAQPARTGTGALAHARALRATGQTKAADAEIIRAWTSLQLSRDERLTFQKDFASLVGPRAADRLDMTLWQDWSDSARALLPFVDDATRAVAETRLALMADAQGVNARLDALSEAQRAAPGVVHARFEWRMRKGLWPEASDLIEAQSRNAASLGRPEAWARYRLTLARDAMRTGDGARAYRLASQHFLSDGQAYADLEWLSGYVALRLLNTPDRAVTHFERFLAAVDTPISLGRAGYWLGRAHEAAGRKDAAAAAYAKGAAFQTSFYGLLAAERGGLPFDPTLAGTEPFPDWGEAPFLRSSVFDAAILLLAGGEVSLSERFFTHLAESLDRTQIGQMGAMLDDFDQPHIQVMLGKRAARYGMQVPGPYYALHPLAERDHPVPTELVLAISRRESEFDPVVVSPVGARGMMQLMPATGREMARKQGVSFSARRLLSDPDYNITLGSAYLQELAQRFDGNPVLMAAAYNAGPSRPDRWMRLYGDPRQGDVGDVIDWIERIPFNETRNYVMRVTESLPVYRARLGLDPLPQPFGR
ncbi:MAG: lytic transglycosylase domain-containing protein, partial [Paracoccaceae bacterium]